MIGGSVSTPGIPFKIALRMKEAFYDIILCQLSSNNSLFSALIQFKCVV